MNEDVLQDLDKFSTEELEAIVHRGDNLNIPTSQASKAQRILESRRHAELIAATQKQGQQKEKVMSSTDLTIFYSWQSDLPNKTNRNLIEEALEIAVKKIRQDSSIKIIPRLDKDTSGVPGSPNIAMTILEKIDHSFLVVSDVSIINPKDKSRSTPNPNVLFELGYAVKSLGMNNVVMVQNIAFGDPQKLPFDLKIHRVLTYNCGQNGNISQSRNDLATRLENAIRLSLGNTQPAVVQTISAVDEFLDLIGDNQPVMILESKLKKIVDQTLDALKQTNLYNYNDNSVTADEFNTRKQKVEEILKDLITIYFDFGRWANRSQIGVIIRQFERILHIPEPDSYKEIWENLARYPGLLVFYAIGLGAIYNDNIEILKSVLDVKLYNRSNGEDEPIYHLTSSFNVFRHYKDVTKDKRYFPASDDLFDLFKPNFEDLAIEKYEDIFDRFEYLLSLLYGTWEIKKSKNGFWVPTGSYTWRTRRRKIWEVVTDNFNKSGEKWLYFNCFELDKTDLERVFTSTNAFAVKIANMVW